MELYPRIGKYFDLKTWTNCRMGMMSWAVLIVCYAAKQRQATGGIADSMLVSVALMQIYIFKFFLCAPPLPPQPVRPHPPLPHTHIPCPICTHPAHTGSGKPWEGE